MILPLITVDGVEMPTPSKFSYGLQDISDSDSGRTLDTIMHKNRIGQKVKIELAWQNISWARTSQILKAFNPEYIEVTYPDMMTGKMETKTFYVGDRSAPVKLWWDGYEVIEEVAFNIIER